MKIILGSQSPRRREIMDYFSLPFVQVASDFDEDSIVFDGNPAKHAMLLSQKKAETLSVRFPNEVILTADTVVSCKGKLYNKPRDEHEAVEFLRTFSVRGRKSIPASLCVAALKSIRVLKRPSSSFISSLRSRSKNSITASTFLIKPAAMRSKKVQISSFPASKDVITMCSACPLTPCKNCS